MRKSATTGTLKPPIQTISPNQSYSNFVTYIGEPQFNAQDYVDGETSFRQVLLYKEIFDFLDTNNNGVLQPMDLRKALTHFGYHPKKAMMYQIMADFDSDKSGIIEFKEFVKMMAMKPSQDDTPQDIEIVFDNIDTEMKGYIDKDDLIALGAEYQEDISDAQALVMIRKCDPDGRDASGNPVIRLPAFQKYMKKKTF